MGISVWEGSKNADDMDAAGVGGMFGDAETRSFYEDLPDLLSMVPLTVLGLTGRFFMI